jgi:hypothetical protein
LAANRHPARGATDRGEERRSECGRIDESNEPGRTSYSGAGFVHSLCRMGLGRLPDWSRFQRSRAGWPRPPRCTTLVIVMMVMVMVIMPAVPPMMMVMMVGELRFTAGPRLGVLRFVRHERGQGIGDRIEKLPIACRRRGLGQLRRCGSLWGRGAVVIAVIVKAGGNLCWSSPMRKAFLFVFSVAMFVGGLWLLSELFFAVTAAPVTSPMKIVKMSVLAGALLTTLGAYLLLSDFIAPLLGISSNAGAGSGK